MDNGVLGIRTCDVEEKYIPNTKLRVKVTDKCNMNCWFCHGEGNFLCDDMVVDKRTEEALINFREIFDKVHLTGGEPFLYRDLGEMVDLLKKEGYRISVTSNGSFAMTDPILRIMEKLEYVNISFHSMEPSYYSALSQTDIGNRIVERIMENISLLRNVLPVRINTVVSGNGEKQKLLNIIEWTSQIHCELKFVPELRTKEEALSVIEQLLEKQGFHMYQRIYIIPGSNMRERYADSDGNVIEVKKLCPCHPNSICSGCGHLGLCEEGFSFLRIGGNPLYCQACINKPVCNYEEFMQQYWNDLKMEFSSALTWMM